MALYECDLTLKKMRVYRDSAELLFFAQPQSTSISCGADSPDISAWRLPFKALSQNEKASLRILSPRMTLLHTEWTDRTLFAEIAQQVSETEPVKPLSLPPPKRLSEAQKKVPKSQAHWALLPAQIKEMVLKAIQEESEIHEQQTPSSLKSINRQLQISETLNVLNERWKQENTDHSTSKTQVERDAKEQEAKQDSEMLCLYFQTQNSEHSLYSPHLPKALSGAWIDSIPPSLLDPEEETAKTQPNQEPKGLWLRLLVEHVYWTPSLVLSLHGDTGRLNVMASLQAQSLCGLLQTVLAKQHQSDHLEIKLEWINHKYHQSIKAIEQGKSQESVITLKQLFKSVSDDHRISSCFKSLLLMSRSLRDLEGEVALAQSLKRLKLSDTTPNSNQNLGYFCDFVRYKYPPALTLGNESALQGQRQVRLCLPYLDPFFDELLNGDGLKQNWEVIIGGVAKKLTPVQRHGVLLHFNLEASTYLQVERIEQGLKFLSTSSQSCRIGVLSIEGAQVIDEIEIAPLGMTMIKNLEQNAESIQQVQQTEHQVFEQSQSLNQAQELWGED